MATYGDHRYAKGQRGDGRSRAAGGPLTAWIRAGQTDRGTIGEPPPVSRGVSLSNALPDGTQETGGGKVGGKGRRAAAPLLPADRGGPRRTRRTAAVLAGIRRGIEPVNGVRTC